MSVRTKARHNVTLYYMFFCDNVENEDREVIEATLVEGVASGCVTGRKHVAQPKEEVSTNHRIKPPKGNAKLLCNNNKLLIR